MIRIRKHHSSITAVFTLTAALLVICTSSVFAQGTKSGKAKGKKEIAITFNELPASGGFDEVDVEAVTFLLLDALKRHKVTATGFVVGEQIDTYFDVLGKWLNDGHTLGTMTYSNQDLHEIGIEKFIKQIKMGEEALKPMIEGFGQKRRYFRFPYLHYGQSMHEKTKVQEYLDEFGYRVAHASVVPDDYLYDLTLQKMGKVPDSVEFVRLLNEYVNHVLDEIERVEQVCLRLEGRPVRQILQLRANRLNAVYLDEMLTALEDMGYTFISLDRALSDPVYDRAEAYFGPTGAGYPDMVIRSDPDLVPAE